MAHPGPLLESPLVMKDRLTIKKGGKIKIGKIRNTDTTDANEIRPVWELVQGKDFQSIFAFFQCTYAYH